MLSRTSATRTKSVMTRAVKNCEIAVVIVMMRGSAVPARTRVGRRHGTALHAGGRKDRWVWY